MKSRFFKFLILFTLGIMSFSLVAQNKKTKSAKRPADIYPASFVITKEELGKLLSLKNNESLVYPANKYIDKSLILMSTKNGDMKFLKAKLNFFANSSLLVQVNGEYTTQIFIMSKDKSVFYKAKADRDKFILNKCTEDEIVSE